MASNKFEAFLYGMVTAEFLSFANYEHDYEALKSAERMQIGSERILDSIGTQTIATLIEYTVNMTFNWVEDEDIPEEFLALEELWQMIQSQNDPGDIYLFAIKNVDAYAFDQWADAKNAAHSLWKPARRKPEQELTEKDKNDPN